MSCSHSQEYITTCFCVLPNANNLNTVFHKKNVSSSVHFLWKKLSFFQEMIFAFWTNRNSSLYPSNFYLQLKKFKLSNLFTHLNYKTRSLYFKKNVKLCSCCSTTYLCCCEGNKNHTNLQYNQNMFFLYL